MESLKNLDFATWSFSLSSVPKHSSKSLLTTTTSTLPNSTPTKTSRMPQVQPKSGKKLTRWSSLQTHQSWSSLSIQPGSISVVRMSSWLCCSYRSLLQSMYHSLLTPKSQSNQAWQLQRQARRQPRSRTKRRLQLRRQFQLLLPRSQQNHFLK